VLARFEEILEERDTWQGRIYGEREPETGIGKQ
jgi:hypothetical protein